MAWRLVRRERSQFLLQGISKPRMAVLAQKDNQLGPTNALDESVFRRREVDWGMPQRWTQGKPSVEHGKKIRLVSHAITSWKNTRPVF
jgi:hypothetical protein